MAKTQLLYVLQALDLDDPVLSAYHEWVKEVAKHFDHVEVICLKLGRHDMPANVCVHSLGKEKGNQSRSNYSLRFMRLAWRLRSEYDTVFVHMNQEYILIAGWLWKLLGKPIYLWRNHYAGNPLTDIAAAFCKNTFCTSAHSYTAKYRKNILMPVGVNLARFGHVVTIAREPHSILFFARIAPSKHAEMLVEALGILKQRGVAYVARIVGSPLPENEPYYKSLKARAKELNLDTLEFKPGIKNDEAPDLYATHEIFVNCSPSGMLDKMLFEAAASGCLVSAISADWNKRAGTKPFTNAAELADQLEALLSLSEIEAAKERDTFRYIAEQEGLEHLMAVLSRRIGA